MISKVSSRINILNLCHCHRPLLGLLLLVALAWGTDDMSPDVKRGHDEQGGEHVNVSETNGIE
eukprot:m.9139 g.9139  ORF g.9139 m.9139 type:complete len:63 (-) comp3371_c0_seq1:400-588(-)